MIIRQVADWIVTGEPCIPLHYCSEQILDDRDAPSDENYQLNMDEESEAEGNDDLGDEDGSEEEEDLEDEPRLGDETGAKKEDESENQGHGTSFEIGNELPTADTHCQEDVHHHEDANPNDILLRS